MLEQWTGKLGNMKKVAVWVVYPQRTAESVVLQTDKRIASFNPLTGKGLISKHCASGAYFIYLARSLGATEIQVDPTTVAAILAACPKPGAQVGPGVYAL